MNREDQIAADEALLSALRRHIETDGNRLIGPTGEAIDEMEVEGLAVLMRTWAQMASDPSPAIRAEHGEIRTRIDEFAKVAGAGGLL